MSFLGVPLHFLLVHFPIGLALTAVILDCRGRFTGATDLHHTGYRLTVGAAAGAVLAAITGMQRLGGRTDNPTGSMHATAGLVVTIAWLVFAFIRYAGQARRSEIDEPFPLSWLALELFAALAVITAAITGHRFVLGQ